MDCQSPQRTAPGSRTSAARRWQCRQRRRYPRRRHRLRVCIATVSKGPPDYTTAPAAIARRRTRRLIAHPGRGGAAALVADAGAACDEPRAKASASLASCPSANKQQRGVRAFTAGDGALLRREPATSNGHAHARQPANIHSLPWSSTAGSALLLLLTAGGCAARAAGASTATTACDGREQDSAQSRFGPWQRFCIAARTGRLVAYSSSGRTAAHAADARAACTPAASAPPQAASKRFAMHGCTRGR